MAISTATLAARAPDLASLDAAVLQACVDEALLNVDAGNWSSSAQYDNACLYYALHLAAKSRMGSTAGGAITSMSAGPMSRSYAAPKDTGDDLSSTTWGRLFRDACAGNVNLGLPLSIG